MFDAKSPLIRGVVIVRSEDEGKVMNFLREFGAEFTHGLSSSGPKTRRSS